jgi:hypothetical protein
VLRLAREGAVTRVAYLERDLRAGIDRRDRGDVRVPPVVPVRGALVKRPRAIDLDASAQSPYERPMTSSITSSVPAPMRFRRMSRQARSIPYSFM